MSKKKNKNIKESGTGQNGGDNYYQNLLQKQMEEQQEKEAEEVAEHIEPKAEAVKDTAVAEGSVVAEELATTDEVITVDDSVEPDASHSDKNMAQIQQKGEPADSSESKTDAESQPEQASVEGKNVRRNIYVDNEGEDIMDLVDDSKTPDGDKDNDADNKDQTVDDDAEETELDEDDEEDEDEDEELVKEDTLSLSVLFKLFKKSWWMFALNSIIIGTIAALLIVEDPRTYTSTVRLAPETDEGGSVGSLSSIASSFGIDIGSKMTSDAIRPDLYPDLVSSNDFMFSLFSLPVKSLDGNVYTDLYTYLKKYQRQSWWRHELFLLKKKISGKQPERKIAVGTGNGDGQSKQNIHVLSKDEEDMIEGLKNKIVCSVDKQTFIISITVTDQDPLICCTIADSVRSKIQNFITDYRTKKAIKDYQYYYGLLVQAKKEYEKSCQAYAQYVDSHRDVILQAYISERDQLENDMQLKLNTYNAMITQTQTAKAKIQENTPAFTILQHAFVPVKPTGPKRMLFVLGAVLLTVLATAICIVLRH